jgi:hypothetical protein
MASNAILCSTSRPSTRTLSDITDNLSAIT